LLFVGCTIWKHSTNEETKQANAKGLKTCFEKAIIKGSLDLDEEKSILENNFKFVSYCMNNEPLVQVASKNLKRICGFHDNWCLNIT
jgi:hypothetical protein